MRTLAMLALAVAAAAFSVAVPAQSFPSKPVRIVISFPPGGSVDFLGRTLAEKLTENFGQPVVVENRPGGFSIIAAESVARAPADGYTLLLALDSTLTQNPGLFAKLPYDPVRDFAPVSQLTAGATFLMTHAKSGFRTLDELIAFAKANPGKLNFAVTGVNNQLVAHQLRGVTGVSIVEVPYKGTAPMMQALVAGEVHLVADSPSTYSQHFGPGRLLPIASMASRRLLFNTPTVRELGFPQLEFNTWLGLFAPGATPQPVIARLNAEVVKVNDNADFKERLTKFGIIAATSTPEQLGAMLREDIARWTPIIKAAGLKLD